MSEPAKDAVIVLKDLKKTFHLGLRLKRVDALRGVSISVLPGRVFGFLGPNGAGKTTAIKIITGLIHPTSGSVSILGKPAGSSSVGSTMGYMPEHPYFYDYLSAYETVCFYGRLFGMDRKTVRARANELLDRVGLSKSKNIPIRKYSKGMKQRLGIAQSLINDPELIILDEPMSGLDPIGRKEVRDILFEQKRAGKTVFFSSHILSDIEVICDDVAIIHHGTLIESGVVSDLLTTSEAVEIMVRPSTVDDREWLGQHQPERMGNLLRFSVPSHEVNSTLSDIMNARHEIIAVTPRRATLEELFVREIRAQGSETTDQEASCSGEA
jgi:ABC-2 type transport system ATP-binding protein